VLISAIFRSQPNSSFGFGATPEGNSTGLSANFATTVNGQAANLNLLEPGVYFADRINQLDARFGKILRFGRFRSSLAVDLLNIFNSTRHDVSDQLRRWFFSGADRDPESRLAGST
jgi:hypothetical protein